MDKSNIDDGMVIAPTAGTITSDQTFGLETIEPEEDDFWEDDHHPNFIEGSSNAITMQELQTKCIIPTFSDSTLTISHQNFINAVETVAAKVFGELTQPELRVSHPIVGRIPSAQHKKANELLDNEKTVFYQRLAFISHAKNITRSINGQSVSLTIGGVRAYNEDKLYSPRQTPMKFKIFVGWRVRVCSNLMLTCNGYSGTINCLTEADIMQKAFELFSSFQPQQDETLTLLEDLQNTFISEEQFCQIVGRMRLYQYLPSAQQKALPSLLIGDQAVNAMIKNYCDSGSTFGKREDQDSISMWQFCQLANEAIKATNIDKWLERNQNCTDTALGIQRALNGTDTEGYDWFLN